MSWHECIFLCVCTCVMCVCDLDRKTRTHEINNFSPIFLSSSIIPSSFHPSDTFTSPLCLSSLGFSSLLQNAVCLSATVETEPSVDEHRSVENCSAVLHWSFVALPFETSDTLGQIIGLTVIFAVWLESLSLLESSSHVKLLETGTHMGKKCRGWFNAVSFTVTEPPVSTDDPCFELDALTRWCGFVVYCHLMNVTLE